ncbi:DsbA family oxidoreductase [Aurantibacillus circumpalustris]|uniref:DsbA family oxidoreductase n=1 Tax=Aurantibacillus circumpalustris TaxID=3036359 RepID=UPI00295AC9FB|nr:DsbA family oxidoreductase [Aurantibacillus circumpalustris]
MKVEIWSDVMCPFCYIGKRKFEAALNEFDNKENIEIVWKSFQLNSELKTDPSKNTVQHLAETKGWTMEYTRNTIKYVTDMASSVGLNYNFDKAVVANSFDAHRFIQYAKTKNKGDAAEEALFKAYFTEGKNTADHAVLIQLGTEIGLDGDAIKTILKGTDFSEEVKKDIAESQQIGVNGVPFFVVDRKYAVSGAQDSKVFLETLTKAWKEHAKSNPNAIKKSADGTVCTPEGDCK